MIPNKTNHIPPNTQKKNTHIDHRVEHIRIGTQIRMTNGIRLMQLHHVRQQGIRPCGGIAVHALGKRVDDGAVGDHVGFDAEVSLIVHQVHALEEVLGLLCRAFASGFGVGVDDHIVLRWERWMEMVGFDETQNYY